MKFPNRLCILITTANFILIWCITLLNSTLNPWGIFLYLPGLFFLPHYQLLDSYRSLISLGLSGFFLDNLLNHGFGFHAFFLGFVYLLSKEFFHFGKQGPKEIIIFQGITNFLLSITWLICCGFFHSNYSNWDLSRFLPDILISTLILIPVSIWYAEFCNKIMHYFIPLHRQSFTFSK